MKSLPNILSCLLALSLCACSEDPPTTPQPNNQTGNPALGYIGFGYDLTENWADQAGKRGIVFDATKLPSGFLQTSALEQLSFSQITASSVEEYENRMSAGLSLSGSYKYFSGAVRANFSADEYKYTGRSFSTIQFYVEKSRTDIISNYATVAHLRQYLNDVARADLDGSITPEEVFTRYGTHVMTGAVMGARLDYSVSMETSKIASGSQFELMARAGYKSLFASAEISGQFANASEESTYRQNSTIKIKAYGGKAELAWDDARFNEWRHTIDSNRVWMRFTQAGLIPIWEFCSNETRKNQIRDALPAWIQKSAIVTEDPPPLPPRPWPCIVDIFTSVSDRADSVYRKGLTYYRLAADLNAGVSGATDLYLYYALGPDTTCTGECTPITSLKLGFASSSADIARSRAQEDGHTIVGIDLNTDAGGDFIYLGVKRVSSDAPIRALQVYNQSVQAHVFSRGANQTGRYFDVPAYITPLDLNRGSGGHFIYLQYTKDK